MCCPLCVSHRHECVCVFVRECSDKKSFLLTYFPTMLSSCWSGPHRGLLVSRWCHRPDLPLLYKGFRYHCLCSHNTHSSRLLCSCKPKEQCYFLFQHYKAGLCRKLNRQNLYQTMLRVGWQYNPPPLAFQCVSLSFSLSLFFFSIFLTHLLSFLLARDEENIHRGQNKTEFLCINKQCFFFKKTVQILKYIRMKIDCICFLNAHFHSYFAWFISARYFHQNLNFHFGLTS